MSDNIKVYLREKQDKLQSQWNIFLAVGNGGFLTAIGSKVLDSLYGKDCLRDPHRMLEFCLPLISIFSLGVVAAAMVPVTELVWASILLARNGEGIEEKVDRHWAKWYYWVPEVISAMCFVLGVASGALQLRSI